MNSKVVLITGADNGIGLAMTQTLLVDGYRVAALDLSTGNLETLRAAYSNQLSAHACDVSDADQVRAAVEAVVTSEKAKAGGPLTLALHVRLPKDVHVQANKPRDPSLIPTVLTLTPPDGIKVDEITYPAPSELAQKDRKDTLAVPCEVADRLVYQNLAAAPDIDFVYSKSGYDN